MKPKIVKGKEYCKDCGCKWKTFSELCMCTCHNSVGWYTKDGKYVEKLMICLPQPKKIKVARKR